MRKSKIFFYLIYKMNFVCVSGPAATAEGAAGNGETPPNRGDQEGE